MNNKQRQIIAKQARLLDRVVSKIVVKSVSSDYNIGDPGFQRVVAHNNQAFNPILGITPALTVGQKARIARSLIRQEISGIPSGYSPADWSNTFSFQKLIRDELMNLGRI